MLLFKKAVKAKIFTTSTTTRNLNILQSRKKNPKNFRLKTFTRSLFQSTLNSYADCGALVKLRKRSCLCTCLSGSNYAGDFWKKSSKDNFRLNWNSWKNKWLDSILLKSRRESTTTQILFSITSLKFSKNSMVSNKQENRKFSKLSTNAFSSKTFLYPSSKSLWSLALKKE